MKRLSARRGIRRLTALAVPAALLSLGLGAASVSAAASADGAAAVPRTLGTDVSILPCGIKYAAGSLYIGASNAVYRVSQRTGTATMVAPAFSFGDACGIAVDGAGNVLVADGSEVVAAAAKTGTFYGRRMTAGHVYPLATISSGVTVAEDVQLDPHGNVVFDVDGAPASHTNEEQDSQIFVLAEHTGTFYDQKMTKGKLYVIAGVLNGGPLGDPCDAPASGSARSAAAAAVVTKATKPTKATQANLGYSIGSFRFDAGGNIVLADAGSNSSGPCGGGYDIPERVAVIAARTGTFYGQKMTAGDIYTIAGLGTKNGNGVPSVDSDLIGVSGVAIDQAGNVLVAALNDDYPRGGVRVIAAKSGTFYGQHMTKGDIYALPGLTYTDVVAVDRTGNVLAGQADTFTVQLLAVKTGTYYGVKARAGHAYTIAGTGHFPAS